MSSTFEIIQLSDARWSSHVFSVTHTLFQSPVWQEVVAQEYDFDARVLAQFEDGNIIGGVPFCEITDFRGRYRITYPFSDFCEPVGALDWDAAQKAMNGSGEFWRMRSRLLPGGLASNVRSPGVQQRIQLPATFEEAYGRFHNMQRVNARRAIRDGVEIRKLTGDEALDVFFPMFSRLRKAKFRLLPQARSFFKRVFDAFMPDRGFILCAFANGQPVAAIVLLLVGDVLYYKFGASELSALELRPNNLLFEEAVRYAIAERYRALDLGISDEPGLIRFKEQLGAVNTPYYAYQFGTFDKSDQIRAVESTFGALTEALTAEEVPVSAAQRGGELLYRFFV